MALTNDQASISIVRPATRAAGDFLLVAVTAKGLDSGNICAPDGTWTQVIRTSQGGGLGSVVQATFWSIRPGAGAETYRFTFSTGSCPAAAGTAAAVPASALAVRYTGVDPTNPIDAPAGTVVVRRGRNQRTLTPRR